MEGEQVDKRVILKVIDEGRGIPPDDLLRVFDPFFTTKGSRGTGLGLSIAYGVLTRIGGEISASNNPQGGATFTLSFPSRNVPYRSAAPSPGPLVSPPGRRILVVDDDKRQSRGDPHGHGARRASGRRGPQRPRSYRASSPRAPLDLVLCDLGMPDMNGWRVAREIQTVAPGTTVYMLTGWARDRAARSTAPLGQGGAREAHELRALARVARQRAGRQ